MRVSRGPLVTEVAQTFSPWATHVIRLFRNASFVEVEWTVALEAEDVFLSPNQRPRGHVFRCIHPYSALYSLDSSPLSSRGALSTLRNTVSPP